jgi:hypothetical protein
MIAKIRLADVLGQKLMMFPLSAAGAFELSLGCAGLPGSDPLAFAAWKFRKRARPRQNQNLTVMRPCLDRRRVPRRVASPRSRHRRDQSSCRRSSFRRRRRTANRISPIGHEPNVGVAWQAGGAGGEAAESPPSAITPLASRLIPIARRAIPDGSSRQSSRTFPKQQFAAI